MPRKFWAIPYGPNLLPTSDKHLVIKQYVDNQFLAGGLGDARYLYKENTDPFTPDGDYEPATKKYVDDSAATVSASISDNLTLYWMGV